MRGESNSDMLCVGHSIVSATATKYMKQDRLNLEHGMSWEEAKRRLDQDET